MALKLIDPATGEKIGSTRLAREVLTEAIGNLDSKLVGQIKDTTDWRKHFQDVYAQVSKLEFFQEQNLLEIAARGLHEFSGHIANSRNKPISELLLEGWVGQERVQTFVIRGTAPVQSLSLEGFASFTSAAENWVENNLAEPGLINSYKFIDAHRRLPINTDLLLALGGLAEYAPTRNWLELGGTVAVIARDSKTKWLKMIQHARNTGGTLLVPVLRDRAVHISETPTEEVLAAAAGLDLQDHVAEISSWIAALSTSRTERIVLGQYAYAHGVNHILVQAVQDSIAEFLSKKLSKTKLALAWLGTPTDSTAVPASLLDAVHLRYRERSAATKLRDAILYLPLTKASFFDARFGERLALLDTSSKRQGSSYLLAKRTQRWRAYLAQSQGIKVSYVVAPPAKTKSVLDYRVLRAAFRGAPALGMRPFDVQTARVATTALLLRDLYGPLPQRGATQLHTESAIHGGIWRLIYRPELVWRRATVIGWPGLFTRRSRG